MANCLEEEVVSLLQKNNFTISFAESCTGGLLASTIINVPGASSVINESHITYSNEAKTKYLHVSEQLLTSYGAVSKEVAKQMSLGLKELSHADINVGVTGLAGPDGGTKTKPVGLVYIACCSKENIVVKEFRFGNQSRQDIRKNSVKEALKIIKEVLQ